jgi:exodeoxyribonuclease-3
MRIATWNINSVRARLPNVMNWMDQQNPDVLLLQEIKCEEKDFPALEFTSKGYHIALQGQKGYNGVAIISREPISDLRMGLPGNDADTEARYIEAVVQGVRVASVYLPNGNPVDTEKFSKKLAWMRRLITYAQSLLITETPFVLAGDYNVIPENSDVYDPASWGGDALFHTETRRLWRELVALGLTEAFRALHPHATEAYTFWDYQAGAWPRNHGLRIDHFLLSPEVTDRLSSCIIDPSPRGLEKTSDHVPVLLEIK